MVLIQLLSGVIPDGSSQMKGVLKMSYASITPAELARRQQADPNLELVDVRTPAEFAACHVTFAENIPLDQLDAAEYLRQRGESNAPIYLICAAGVRGSKACDKFLAAGYSQVINVEGGTNACVGTELNVVRGKKAMSLERQVRIVAGSLVVLGAALGTWVHPAWIGLSAFVGAGLVFAGVTDTCGMAMLLGKMPWNQVAKTCQS